MADDDLSAPLGQRPKKKKRFALPISVPHLIAGALGLCASVVAGWTLLVDDPFGGEPMVIVSTDARGSAQAKKAPDDGTPAAPQKPSATTVATVDPKPPAQTVTIIDGSTGKKQEVVVSGGGAPAEGKTVPKLGAASMCASSKRRDTA